MYPGYYFASKLHLLLHTYVIPIQSTNGEDIAVQRDLPKNAETLFISVALPILVIVFERVHGDTRVVSTRTVEVQ